MIHILGVFEIKPEKKLPPEVKTAKQLGMIAGGTGNLFFFSPLFSLYTKLFLLNTIGLVQGTNLNKLFIVVAKLHFM